MSRLRQAACVVGAAAVAAGMIAIAVLSSRSCDPARLSFGEVAMRGGCPIQPRIQR